MPETDASHQPFVTRKVGDREVKFAKFTPRMRAALLKNLRQRRRIALVANLDAAKIESEARFAELEAFDDAMPYGPREFAGYISTTEGQNEVHETALQKYHPAETESILNEMPMGDGDSLLLAVEICNLSLEPARPSQDGAENPPTPPAANPAGLQGYGA